MNRNTIPTIDRSGAYLGILAALMAEREAQEIADTLNPRVAATPVWRGNGALVYETQYFGDVRVTYKHRRHIVVTC